MFGHPYQRVYSEALLAATECGFQISANDAEEGMIKATTKLSFQSWGEEIDINVSSMDFSVGIGAKVTISSTMVTISSRVPNQLLDWANKNKKNIKCFFLTLERRLGG